LKIEKAGIFFLSRTKAWLFFVGLWLQGLQPIAHVGGWYDDFLYVRLANFLLNGQWLGPFDVMTLAKGPFYPMFLAACAWVGIPVQMATASVYLLGGLLLSQVIGQLSRRAWAGTVCFALLALNPAAFDWFTTSLMREPLYGGLTLLVLGAAAKVFLVEGGIGWAVLLGAFAAAFWMTREEGVLLSPSLAVMALWYVWRGARRWTPPAVAASVCVALVLIVCGINRYEYGVFGLTNFQSGPFPRAYGALMRIKPAQWQRLVPVAREQRLRAYAVSPAFRELQPFLEGNVAGFAIDVECDRTPRPACHDISASAFRFALRDAVSRAGHYGRSKDADRFYRRMANEINSACDTGALLCTGARSWFLPPFNWRYGLPFLHSIWRVAGDILLLRGSGPIPIYSLQEVPTGPAYSTLTFGTRISPPMQFLYAPGWQIYGALGSPDGHAEVNVAGPPGTSIQSDLRTSPDPLEAKSLGRPADHGVDFGGVVRCAPGDCRLEVTHDNRVLASFAIAGLHTGLIFSAPEAALYVISVAKIPDYFSDISERNGRHAVMVALSRMMPWLVLPGALMAVIWLCWRGFFARQKLTALYVLGCAVFLTVVTRWLMLALLDVTSFGVEFRYEAPAIGPLMVFISIMLADIANRRSSN